MADVVNNHTPIFLSSLQFEDNGGFPFVLVAPLTYVTNVDNRGVFDVPVGFKTDLASIPRALWNILPPIGKYDAAAVLHDFLYQTACINLVPVSRKQADDILNEAMGVLGVSKVTRMTIYIGIRISGSKSWNQYRSAS